MQKTETARRSGKQVLAIIGIIACIMIVLAGLLYYMIIALTSRGPAAHSTLEDVTQYRYEKLEASNGMILHVLAVRPSNITLEAINENVALAEKTGINGGFFHQGQLLSIAVVNGTAVNGPLNDYGSGGANVKYARGTLVWDGAADALSVQIVSKASELRVKDHTRFWAQGGISMSLGDDEGWVGQTERENAPFPNDDRLRSAAVFDDGNMLYLVVSETKGTLAVFREAIIEQVGGGRLEDGIFLDGDGSSQLLSKEASLNGDGRPVVQMLKILK